jgi:CBS domain-containing protein
VADVMTSPVVTATPDATIEDVARLMIERNIGSVVITDAMGSPVGIVTETDFEVADDPIPFTFLKWPRVLGKYVWSGESLEGIYREMRERHVDSVMSSPVEAVDVNASLWQAVQLMVLRDIKRVPVLDGQRLVGIVSQHDLLNCLLDESGHAGT